MRLFLTVLLSILFHSCANGKVRIFTASTPAGKEVRAFLGIAATDSIDFIRWKLVRDDKKFQLTCTYGIGKPNTNGFYNGGKRVDINGTMERDQHFLKLWNSQQSIYLVELNENLLHFTDPDHNPLAGNGGWSYTLNNIAPIPGLVFNRKEKLVLAMDSLIYVGRTPCNIPGINAGNDCYKLKWKIVFYGGKNNSGRFIVYGSNWRKENLEGHWELKDRNDQSIFELSDKSGQLIIYLFALGDILLFADKEGNLPVGNEDFSYTLNRL